MINVNADCIVSIYENARQKVDSLFELLDDNLTWLDEIQEEARKAFQRYNSKIWLKYNLFIIMMNIILMQYIFTASIQLSWLSILSLLIFLSQSGLWYCHIPNLNFPTTAKSIWSIIDKFDIQGIPTIAGYRNCSSHVIACLIVYL